MGIVTVDREISHATTLQEALKVLVWSGFQEEGLLRVIGGTITGWLAISDGFIRGALVASTGEKGVAALNQLLEMNQGIFNFSAASQHPLPLSEQDLQIHIELVAANSTQASDDALLASMQGIATQSPPGDALRALTQRSQRSMEPPTHKSLTNDQLALLETYRKLTGPLDRAAFLTHHADLARMFDEDGMTVDKRTDLQKAESGVSEADVMSFLEFHRRVLGNAAEVTETQIATLRQLYRDLQTEDKRRVFLAESGMLSEELSVERGDGIWIAEQEARRKELEAIRGPEKVYRDSAALVAVDADTRVQTGDTLSLDKVRRRRRGDAAPSIGPQGWWQRPEIFGICVSVSLVGAIAYLVYSQVVQSAYIEATKPEEDLITMDLILDDTLAKEVPRVAKDVQVALLVPGSEQAAAQAGAGKGSEYWKQQSALARRMIAQGRLKEASSLLDTLVSQDPYDLGSREVLVEALLRSGQRHKAREVAISGLTYARRKEDRQVMEKLFTRCIGD